MKENNIQIDLCRDGGVVARLHLPLKSEEGKTDFQVLESILNEPCVKGVIETVAGSKPEEEPSPSPNDDQYAEWKAEFTEDEICNVAQKLRDIEDALTEIKKTLHIAITSTELPF